MLIAEKEYEAAVRYVLDEAGISIDDGSEEDVYRVLYNAGLSDENGNTDVYENTRHAREILLDFVISMLPDPEREIIMENRKNVVQMNKVLEIARKFADA